MQAIEELIKVGFSKYRIAYECNVSWNTVQNWSKGIYTPDNEHSLMLLALLKKAGIGMEFNNQIPRERKKEIPQVITQLLQAGLSKYYIAKYCNVQWKTVHMWCEGIFAPTEKNCILLQELANNNLSR